MTLGPSGILRLILFLALVCVLLLRERRFPLAWRRKVVSAVLTVRGTSGRVETRQRRAGIGARRWLRDGQTVVVEDVGTGHELSLRAISRQRFRIVLERLTCLRRQHSAR